MKTYSNHYSEDLTVLELESAGNGAAAGDKLNEPLDESLYKELMGGSPDFLDLDNIVDLMM